MLVTNSNSNSTFIALNLCLSDRLRRNIISIVTKIIVLIHSYGRHQRMPYEVENTKEDKLGRIGMP